MPDSQHDGTPVDTSDILTARPRLMLQPGFGGNVFHGLRWLPVAQRRQQVAGQDWAKVRKAESRKNRSRKREASGEEETNHPWAVAGQAVAKPCRWFSIAPGPCRGWGRKPLARIHAQTEPVVSPAGAGREHRSPRRVSPCFCMNGKSAGKPLGDPRGKNRSGGKKRRTECLPAFRWKAHVVSEGRDMFGIPQGEGERERRREKGSGGRLAPRRSLAFYVRRGVNGSRAFALGILAA